MMKKLTLLFLLLNTFAYVLAQGIKPQLKVQIGNNANITKVLASPDEKKALFLMQDRSLKCWDIDTGKELFYFQSVQEPIQILPDGKSFLIQNLDNSIVQYSLVNGTKMQTFEKHSDRINQIRLSPDAKTFLSSSHDNSINLWSLDSGKLLKTFTGHPSHFEYYPYESKKKQTTTNSTYNVVYLPSKKFLSSSGAHDIKLWDLDAGKVLQSFEGHQYPIEHILPISDTEYFISTDESGTIKYWHYDKPEAVYTLNAHTSQIINLYYLPENHTLLTGSLDGKVIHWDLNRGKSIKILDIVKNQSKFKVWDFKEGKYKTKLKTLAQFQLMPDKQHFLFSSLSDKEVVYWNLSEEKPKATYQSELQTYAGAGVEFWQFLPLPNQKTVLIRKNQQQLLEYDLASGSVANEFGGIEAEFSSNIAILPKSNSFLVTGYGKSSQVSRFFLGKKPSTSPVKTVIKQEFVGKASQIKALSLANNKSFVTRSGEGNIMNDAVTYWNLETLKRHEIQSPNADSFKQIDFINDTLFLARYFGVIALVNTKTGKIIKRFEGHQKEVMRTIFLKEQSIFLSFDTQKVITWSIVGKEKVGEVRLQGDIDEFDMRVSNILLASEQHSFFIIQGIGETINQYNLETGKKIFSLKTIIEDEEDAIFSSIALNNQHLIIGDYFGNIIFYEPNKLLNNKIIVEGESIENINYKDGINNQNLTWIKVDEYQAINDIIQVDNKILTLSGVLKEQGKIKCWDIDSGKMLARLEGRYGNFLKMKIAANKKRLFTLNQQNSITVWDLENFQEIVSIIPSPNNAGSFIITTPENYYYTAKKGIDKLLSYAVDDQVYVFSQFDLQYNRPDIILERIGLASDTLIQTYRLAYQKRLEKMDFSEERIKLFMNGEFEKDFNAPEIELLGKGNSVREETTQSEYTFSFTATDAKYNIERIFVNVDGVPLYGAKGFILENPSQNLAKRDIKVPLIAGKNIITLSVINAQGVASLEKRLEITYNPPQPTKPTLYVFSIGVNEYQDEDITKLDYAVKDAEKVVELFAQNKGDFAAVKKFTLTDAEVNKNSVSKLRQELLKTKPEDIVIFSFAGHGFADDKTNYYLATYDTKLDDLSKTGLRYDELESLLDSIPARKKLMLIDACNSGEIDGSIKKLFEVQKRKSKRTQGKQTSKEEKNDEREREVQVALLAFEVMKASFSDLRIGTGTTVISASGGLEAATEDYTWGHGAFTYTLIQGLQEKKADLDENGKITVSELQTYLAEEVQRLTDGFQKPTSRIENIVNDFVVW